MWNSLQSSGMAGKTTNPTRKSKVTSMMNVLGNDDESETDDNSNAHKLPKTLDDTKCDQGRAVVNKALQVEQEQLRKQQQALTAADGTNTDTSIYDYDGVYDTFHHPPATITHPELGAPLHGATGKPEPSVPDRSSRYIGDLLKTAQRRKRERDIIYEKRVAREQAAEEAQSDFRGKDKFITTAYKEKLKERELWQAEEIQREREEAANDVTKRTGGMALASFYGNLSRNVAMGGGLAASGATGGADRPLQNSKPLPANNDDEQAGEQSVDEWGRIIRGSRQNQPHRVLDDTKQNFTDGFEKIDDGATNQRDEVTTHLPITADDGGGQNRKRQIREAREIKVKQALERYMKRHNLVI